MLVDTHAHLDDPSLWNDRHDVLRRAADAGVRIMVAVGTSVSSSRACIQLAEESAHVYAAVGIHPNQCAQAAADDWDQIIALTRHPRVVALGETGLDRHADLAPFNLQQDYFQRHIELSQQTGLPFIVHMRACLPVVLEMLRQAARRGPLRGIMHSYTGDGEGADECVQMGLHISFAGMVTFPKESALRGVAAGIPGDRILVETDSPYLSPHPLRGRWPNEPARVVHTAACLAETRRVDFESFCSQTTRNACALLGVSA